VSSALFAPPTRDALAEQHPEWRQWLALLDVVADEASRPAWAEAVPSTPSVTAPVLEGTALAVERSLVDRFVRRLFAASEAPALRDAVARTDPLVVLEAAVNVDTTRLDALAVDIGAPPSAVAAVAPLVAMPWLGACGRRLGSATPVDAGWCPVCGAWPILAEVRGLEGERRLRCARCGGDWRTQWLACPYCGTDDHTRLASLVAEATGDRRKIEACRDCSGYVKTLTTLAAADAATLRLLDLSTVDLDVAALERGFTRRSGLGHPLGVTVIERPPRRFWRR